MRAIRAVVLASFLATLATTASAIPVTITYAIGGGQFSYGPYNSGSVTSGTLQILFPTAISLYSSPVDIYNPPIVKKLTLNGPSGYFKLLSPPTYGILDALFGTIRQTFESLTSDGIDYVSFLSGTAKHRLSAGFFILHWDASGTQPRAPRTRGIGALGGAQIYLTFSFTPATGHEVSRVPEPTSINLVLLGLAGLAGAGGARRLTRHR